MMLVGMLDQCTFHAGTDVSYIFTLLISFLGRLVAGLVAEFLRFFNLDFTLAVFQPESSTVRYIGFICMLC